MTHNRRTVKSAIRLLAFYSVLAILPSCSVHTKERVVFIAGKDIDAFQTFLAYERDVLAKEKNRYSLHNIKVIIWDGKDFREFSINWYDYILDCILHLYTPYCVSDNILLNLAKPGFIGSWQRLLWWAKLSNYKLSIKPETIEIAKSKGWEVFVLSDTEKETLDKISVEKEQILSQPTFRVGPIERLIRVILGTAIMSILYVKRMRGILVYPLILLSIILILTGTLGDSLAKILLKWLF